MVQLNHYQTLEKMKNISLSSEIILFLCGISSENLGLILRSADIFGVKKVVYFGNELENKQKIKKLSRNSTVDLEFTDDKNFLHILKEDGYLLVALEITDSAEPISQMKLNKKTCLIVGNEQHGIPQEMLDACEKSYYIEMASKNISSLNVAIATSIALNKYLEINQNLTSQGV